MNSHFLLLFLINSILLGIGLAVDAFSVSIVNSISEPDMKKGRQAFIAGIYAAFQFAMPMLGWLCVHTIASIFTSFQKFIPYIAFLLLAYLGIKMIFSSIKDCKKNAGEKEVKEQKEEPCLLSTKILILQGIATSIDALSVGFTIAEYKIHTAFTASTIIAAVTFAICLGGLAIGKIAGKKLSEKAQITGGIILTAIGLEILIRSIAA